MIDTVILQLSEGQFTIVDPSKFNIYPETLMGIRSFAKSQNNPTAEDKKKGIYKPRLTLYKRNFKLHLKIEFSAPKLLWLNNIDELSDNDFDEIVNTLRDRIIDMGVMVWGSSIEKAEVLSFHPSKNIPICNGYTASLAIREIKKVDVSKLFDMDYKEYRNGGEVLQFYSKIHSLVLYDKVRDIGKPVARAIDKDQTIFQASLFDSVKRSRLELLRMEVRLCGKRKMNEILRKVGYAESPFFSDIFKKDLCKKILNLYWDKFFDDYKFITSFNNSPQRLLQAILGEYPRLSLKTALEWVALVLLAKDEEGLRGLRYLIENKYPKANWNKIKKRIDKFVNPIFARNLNSFIYDIERELGEFKPFKLQE